MQAKLKSEVETTELTCSPEKRGQKADRVYDMQPRTRRESQVNNTLASRERVSV